MLKAATGLIDTVGRQIATPLAAGIEEIARWIHIEGARNGFGGLLAQGCERAVCVDRITCNTIVAAVGDIEKAARWIKMDLRTSILASKISRNGGQGLERRQGALGGIKLIGGDTAALFVGEIENVLRRVIDVMARTNPWLWCDLGWIIGNQLAAVRIKT